MMYMLSNVFQDKIIFNRSLYVYCTNKIYLINVESLFYPKKKKINHHLTNNNLIKKELNYR